MTSSSPSASSPSRKALSKIACSRLQKELAEWQVNPPAGFKHRVTDNLQRSYFCIRHRCIRTFTAMGTSA
ncbi:hypothetical protein BAE44_0020447 [Dichanthelium oligosanthes]|uniref:Uncharacterized protein n=1 Tax=Dichanthelium oligosanthes TaxID=888268 RepID=A0A1E5V0H8_9POAL|nr:hypothetical protein BAE44_0020447 [Dichanthelium oligosanthes]